MFAISVTQDELWTHGKSNNYKLPEKKKDYFESYGVGKYFSYYKGIIRKKKIIYKNDKLLHEKVGPIYQKTLRKCMECDSVSNCKNFGMIWSLDCLAKCIAFLNFASQRHGFTSFLPMKLPFFLFLYSVAFASQTPALLT